MAGEGDDRGWDGCVASPTQWTWVWASSGRWWRTGQPGVLQSMGSQRNGHDWAMEEQQSASYFTTPCLRNFSCNLGHSFSSLIFFFPSLKWVNMCKSAEKKVFWKVRRENQDAEVWFQFSGLKFRKERCFGVHGVLTIPITPWPSLHGPRTEHSLCYFISSSQNTVIQKMFSPFYDVDTEA